MKRSLDFVPQTFRNYAALFLLIVLALVLATKPGLAALVVSAGTVLFKMIGWLDLPAVAVGLIVTVAALYALIYGV
jgi:hypothetical protein